jgi:hypothetical protein
MRTSIIVEPDEWFEFQKVARAKNTGRAELIQQFIREQNKRLRAA